MFIDRIIDEIKLRISKKTEKIKNIEASIKSNKLDEGCKSIAAITDEHNFYRNLWKDRKAMCTNIIDLLVENTESKMKPKTLMVYYYLFIICFEVYYDILILLQIPF